MHCLHQDHGEKLWYKMYVRLTMMATAIHRNFSMLHNYYAAGLLVKIAYAIMKF